MKKRVQSARGFKERLREFFLGAPNLTGVGGPMPRNGKRPLVDRFAEVLSVQYYDEATRLFWLNEGGGTPVTTIAAVFEVAPLLGADAQATESFLRMLTADFPPQTTIAASLYASPDVRGLLSEYVASRAPQAPSLTPDAQRMAQTMAVKRSRRMDGAARALGEKGVAPVRRMRVWVCLTCRVGEVASLSVLKTGRLDAEPRCAQFSLAAKAVETTLAQLHVLMGRWDDGVYTATMRELVNAQGWVSDVEAFMQSVSAPNNYAVLKDGVVFHDTVIDVARASISFETALTERAVEAVALGVTAYPAQVHLNLMSELYGTTAASGAVLRHPFLMTCVIEPTPLSEDRAVVGVKHARVRQLAGTEIGQFLTDLPERERDLDIAGKSCAAGRGLARVAHSLVVWARKGRAAEAAQAAKNVLARIGMDAHVDAGLQMMGLLTALPMEGSAALMADVRTARRAVTLTKESAARMLPVLGEYRGTLPRVGRRLRTPMVMLVTRRGELFPVDVFANRNGNFNAVIAGTSGSGKSVLAQEIVMSVLATGGRVWVFDIGKSYQNVQELTHGQFIDFDRTVNGSTETLCLNPLDMLDDPAEMLDELAQVIEVMANDDVPLDPTVRERLKQHIDATVKAARAAGRTPTITDLTVSLMDTREPGLCDLAVRLMPYSRGGRFEGWFEGRANVDFQKALVVLEMEALSNKPTLQHSVLLVCIMRILADIRSAPRSATKLIVIDEAWRLLSGNTGRFIEWACRTLRKYGAGIICISQSMEDFQATSAARAVRMNADSVFLLRQKAEGIAAYTDDPHLRRTLAGLTTRAESYSEVFVRIGDSPGVVARLMLDKFSMTAYSTRADVFEAVRGWRRAGASVEDAVLRVASGDFAPRSPA